MAQTVYFWILEDDAPSLETCAADAIAKGFETFRQQLVWVQDETRAHEMDELLWQLPPERFLPHALIDKSDGTEPLTAPIEISYKTLKRAQHLVNLSSELPNHWQQFAQITDFAPSDESLRAIARERFKQYRAAGAEIVHQKWARA